MLIYMMMLETPEEKSLFEQIYLEYRGLMFHVAYEILHNEQDAEDAEARTAFFAWVREQYESFVEYRFIGDAPKENDIIRYELTWLPDGFSLETEQSLGSGTYLIYTDDSGQRIIFSYLQGNDSSSLFVAADYTEVQSVQIGNIKADFYQASQAISPNGLVWVSEEENLCFCITASLPKDTMIKLAEGIQKK